MGTMLAGGAAAAAVAYGAHQMSHGGSHGYGHGGYHGYGHGKFKHGYGHGKFKHGKFGKRWKHGGFGKHKGKFFKRWKWFLPKQPFCHITLASAFWYNWFGSLRLIYYSRKEFTLSSGVNTVLSHSYYIIIALYGVSVYIKISLTFIPSFYFLFHLLLCLE